jgi:hypothetical protein
MEYQRWASTSGAPSASRPPSREIDETYDLRRWLFAGLAALFVLIGVTILLDVAISLSRGQLPSSSLSSDPWN